MFTKSEMKDIMDSIIGVMYNENDNKVNKHQCLQVYATFLIQNYLDDLNTDNQYYVKILLKKVANDYNIKLEDIDNDDFDAIDKKTYLSF